MPVQDELKSAIAYLERLDKKISDPQTAFESLAPYTETDFVPWFFTQCKTTGLTEIPSCMLKQACESKGIELTISAGHWFRNFGFTNTRTKNGLRWYDLTESCYDAGDLHRTIYGKAPE